MAKNIPTVDAPIEAPPVDAKVLVTNRLMKKQAQLLLDISGCYRDAAKSLRTNDEAGYISSWDLIKRYQDLFDALATKQADAVTAEGLAKVNES